MSCDLCRDGQNISGETCRRVDGGRWRECYECNSRYEGYRGPKEQGWKRVNLPSKVLNTFARKSRWHSIRKVYVRGDVIKIMIVPTTLARVLSLIIAPFVMIFNGGLMEMRHIVREVFFSEKYGCCSSDTLFKRDIDPVIWNIYFQE